MNVLAELEKLQKAAMRDPVLRQQLLQSREAAEPVSRFCKVARGAGYDINEMDLIYAEEEAYAGMRRATNGGGENSPMLENEDDYYSLFMSAIEK